MYSAIIPKENKINPEKKEIMTTVDVQPGIFSPQKDVLPKNRIYV